MMSCNVISPQFFWFKKLRRNVPFTFIMSIVVNIGMWFERFVIIVTSLYRDYIPGSWSYYSPTWPEVGFYLGTFGLFFTCFFLFAKYFPVIAIAEIKFILKTSGNNYKEQMAPIEEKIVFEKRVHHPKVPQKRVISRLVGRNMRRLSAVIGQSGLRTAMDSPNAFVMSNLPVLPVQHLEVIPTKGGTAVFLVTERKTIVIQVDASVGEALLAALAGKVADRPQSHDLMLHLLLGLDAMVGHVVILEVKDGVFFARIVLSQEGPVARKVAEIDARPSDALVLAVKAKRPVFLSRQVIEACEDMTETLARLRKQA